MGGFNNSIWSGTAGTPIPPPPAQDIYVKVSAGDTTTGYLSDKVVNDGCNDILLSIVNPGGNEQLGIKTNITRGNTLFVSKTGDDATASRENMACHYETVEAAIADAQGGDTVVVYPGTYSLSTPIQKNGVSVYLMPFAELFGNGVSVVNMQNNEVFGIYGQGVLSASGAAVVYLNAVDSNLILECDSVIGSTGVLFTIDIRGGHFIGRIARTVNCTDNAGCFFVAGAGNFYLNCPLLADTSTSNTDRPSIAYTILFFLNYSGQGYVHCDQIIGWQGGPTVQIQEVIGSNVSITCPYMTNKWTTTIERVTCVVGLGRSAADEYGTNLSIYGNIYAADFVRGLVVLSNTTTGRCYFNGNIFCEKGYGVINCTNGYMIDHCGDVVQTDAASVVGAVRVGLDAAAQNYYQGGIYKNKSGTISTVGSTEPPIVIEIDKVTYPNSRVILKETTLIENGGIGYCITSGDASAQNVYIYKAESNVDLDATTITNAIAPTTLIIDANIVL